MSKADEETSIQDDIRAAMAEPTVETTEAPAPDTSVREELISKGVIKPAAESKSLDRDEHGRFKAKEDPAPTAVESAEKVLEQGVAGKWTPERAPTTWSPKAREQWGSLPLDIRQEIVRREEASVNGVRKLQEQHSPVNNFYRAMEPVITEAKSFGVVPEQYISTVMSSERILRTADVPTKFNEILRICDQYGVPLREVINRSVGQEVLKTHGQPQQAQISQQFMQEFQEIRNWRQQMESQQVNNTVEQFGADPKHEFFGDVRGTMADLIEMGKASNMEDAYQMAIWMTPEVREVLMARSQVTQQSNQVATRQLAAASTLKSSGKLAVETEDDSDDIMSAVRSSVKGLSGRL